MKADFNYDEFPGRFAHCLNEKCVRRDTCLGIRCGFVFLKRAEVYILSIRATLHLSPAKSVLSSCSTNRSGSPEA